MNVSKDTLYLSLLEQISLRSGRGLSKGARTTATRSCLELGLLIGQMVGRGEVTEDWAMSAILAIGMGNWTYFPNQKTPSDLASWKPHRECMAYYRPTYLDRVQTSIAKFGRKCGGAMQGDPSSHYLTLPALKKALSISPSDNGHLKRALRKGVDEGVLLRSKGSYRLANEDDIPRMLVPTDPKCPRCSTRLKY